MSQKYKTIDLCAGIGGIRQGFYMTGAFENVLSAEIDEYAAKTYEHLYGEKPLSDLTSEEFKKVIKESEYDVLLAGFPCQTFSSAGLKKGFNDETKGTIFFHIADIIRRTRPKAVFLENVENLLIHNSGKTMETIVRVLEEDLNYKIIGVQKKADGEYEYSRESFLRNSKYFGVPQNRPRVYIMAFDRGLYGSRIELLKDSLPFDSGTKIAFESLDDVLEKDVPINYYLSSDYLETLKRHKNAQNKKGNGFGFCVVNDSKRKEKISNTILATGGSGKERNLVYQPREDYAGKKIPSKRSPINEEGIRVMTPNEWGRLQGFIGYGFVVDGKDLFSFPEGLSDAQKYKQFGNSVSIPVIKSMAEFMLECFKTLNADKKAVVLSLVNENGSATRKDVMNCLKISSCQANYLLRQLLDEGSLNLTGEKRGAKYVLSS